jgi:hypothetical protein
MNRLKTIVLFAGIFGIGLGAISLNDSSAISLPILAATPQIQNEVGMLGHVEYKLMDSAGNIIQYAQNDNLVVHGGMDCVSRMMFDNSTADISCNNFTGGDQKFDFIAISNHTTITDPPTDQTLTELEFTTTGTCATTAASGEMARKQVTPTFVGAIGATGTIVTLDTKDDPFDFGVSNATDPIRQSGVFNGDEATKSLTTGECATLTTTQMFAYQSLSGAGGISVSAGDSLSVKWTIEVG